MDLPVCVPSPSPDTLLCLFWIFRFLSFLFKTITLCGEFFFPGFVYLVSLYLVGHFFPRIWGVYWKYFIDFAIDFSTLPIFADMAFSWCCKDLAHPLCTSEHLPLSWTVWSNSSPLSPSLDVLLWGFPLRCDLWNLLFSFFSARLFFSISVSVDFYFHK